MPALIYQSNSGILGRKDRRGMPFDKTCGTPDEVIGERTAWTRCHLRSKMLIDDYKVPPESPKSIVAEVVFSIQSESGIDQRGQE